MSDGRDDAKKRLEGRFSNDERGAQNAQNEGKSKNVEKSSSGSKSKTSKASKTSKKAKNVKKAWNARSVYLPDDLDERVDREFKRLDFELSDTDVDSFGKTRDYYPLLFSLALEKLDEMDVEDIKEKMND